MSEGTSSNLIDARIGGAKLPEDVAKLLVESWVDLGAGVPGAFQLTFRDPNKLVLGRLKARIGVPVVLSAVANGKGVASPLLTGEVTGLETDYDATGTFTVVRGYDLGHRMLRQRRVVAYTKMTAADIARKLAAQDKVPVGKVDATPTVYESITQPNVSDWDFLSRLADENDRVLSVSPDGRLQFVKPKPASGAPAPRAASPNAAAENPLVLRADRNVLRCRAAVTSADQVNDVEVRGWDVTTKRAVTGRKTAATSPGATIGTTPKKAAAAFPRTRLVGTDTPYDKQAQVKHAADALAADVTAAFSELEVIARGKPELRPGVAVSLADVGEPFEGKYTVTAARHLFPAADRYETWVTVSGRQWRSLYGLVSGGANDSPRLPSVANAVVTDVQDPLRQGRVKLKFPWLSDSYVSDWARTVQFGGVKGGSIIAPDVNDEVLVAFDRGALDHPYVIGGLYNGVDKPVRGDVPFIDPMRGKVNRRTLADRDNNRLDLLDQRTGARKRGVRVSTGDDRLTIHLDRTRTSITVDSRGSVSITGSTSVSVEAGRDLTLSAGRTLTIKSGGLLSLQARGALNARSLTGAVVVNAAAALNLRAAGAVAVNAGGALSAQATGALNLSAGAAANVQAAASVGIRAATIPLLGLVTANGKPVI
ncbi:VgrG-related protein [Streptomyces sp. 8N706]|uniref:VgrG-related protein n=1 Tax=Streptomyces sp. 8N706 TaxID=3457416 RepID=UPI003FD0F4C8